MRNAIILLLLIAAEIAVLSACGVKPLQNRSQSLIEKVQPGSISPEEAQKRLKSGEDVILLDVRTPGEYAENHIPGSVLIPVDELEKCAETELPDKSKVLFVYCRSGNRSTAASNILTELGYKKVYNLGGIIDWPYKCGRRPCVSCS